MIDKKAVVITGASTGIGEACAHFLRERGFYVFAGVRKPADGERLEERSPDGLEPLLIDVTQAASLAAAAERVRDAVGERGLAGLVNNAGISVGGVLELLPIDALQRQLEVNLVGPVATTQAFLPLIRQATGRIVNMGSIAGRVASPVIGAYAMSKFGLRAFNDSLRRELRQWDIRVSLIEPGAIATPIWAKAMRRARNTFKEVDETARQRYGPLLNGAKRAATRSAESAIPPEAVARAVHHALASPKPRTHYLVGRDAKRAAFVDWLVSAGVMDWILAKELEKQPARSAPV